MATGVHGLYYFAAIALRGSASLNVRCSTLLVMNACDYCYVERTAIVGIFRFGYDLPSESLQLLRISNR